MAKCSECGFLAVWLRLQHEFQEADMQARELGRPEAIANDPGTFEIKCFIRKKDLVAEVNGPKAKLGEVVGYSGKIVEVITMDRSCDGYLPWLQGFHPKEHSEMLERKRERRWRLLEGLIFAVAGGTVALFAQWVTKPDVPVINIAPPALNFSPPPPAVTIAPDGKPEKAK